TDVTFYTDGGFGTTGKHDILNITSRVDAASGLMQGWLFAQDGVVMGYVDNVMPDESLSTGFRAWEEGGSTSLSTNTAVAVSCDAGSMVGITHVYDMSPSTILPIGDYEAYPVVQIDTSPKLDAFRTLASQGISTSSVWEGGLSEPGSWDCRQAAEATGLTPAECVEGLYEDASGIATVTVPPELQSPDIHVTLIGVPLPYHRTGEIVLQEPEAWPWEDSESDFDVCTPEQTEAFWAEVNSYGNAPFAPLSGSVVIDPLLTDPALTTSAEILGQPADDGALSGIIDFEVFLNAGPEESQLMYRHVSVGFARATVNGGGAILLDRYTGPTAVTLTLSDVAWCGEPPPEGTTLSATILGSATFTPTGGDEREVTAYFWVAPNGLPYY
ncbi:MAG: hypothetical protein MUP36_02115, partial [Demequinaceae bacterium]|nr:hypothetical protein [Demequinaceae bacterium]